MNSQEKDELLFVVLAVGLILIAWFALIWICASFIEGVTM